MNNNAFTLEQLWSAAADPCAAACEAILSGLLDVRAIPSVPGHTSFPPRWRALGLLDLEPGQVEFLWKSFVLEELLDEAHRMLREEAAQAKPTGIESLALMSDQLLTADDLVNELGAALHEDGARRLGIVPAPWAKCRHQTRQQHRRDARHVLAVLVLRAWRW